MTPQLLWERRPCVYLQGAGAPLFPKAETTWTVSVAHFVVNRDFLWNCLEQMIFNWQPPNARSSLVFIYLVFGLREKLF